MQPPRVWLGEFPDRLVWNLDLDRLTRARFDQERPLLSDGKRAAGFGDDHALGYRRVLDLDNGFLGPLSDILPASQMNPPPIVSVLQYFAPECDWIRECLVVNVRQIDLDDIHAVHREQLTFGVVDSMVNPHFHTDGIELDLGCQPVKQNVRASGSVQERDFQPSVYDREGLWLDYDVATGPSRQQDPLGRP